MSIGKWNIRFSELAKHVADWSKDTSTKVGAIIVNPEEKNPISMGFNGFPARVNDSILERNERPLKYFYTQHAEINAISNAAKNGGKTMGCEMYVNFFPCSSCAGAIVNAGISRLFCDKKPDYDNEKWGESWKISKTIFDEANIAVIFINE